MLAQLLKLPYVRSWYSCRGLPWLDHRYARVAAAVCDFDLNLWRNWRNCPRQAQAAVGESDKLSATLVAARIKGRAKAKSQYQQNLTNAMKASQ